MDSSETQINGSDLKEIIIESSVVPLLEPVAQIRSYWQFAAICQFFSFFYATLGLDYFDSVELEDFFLKPSSSAESSDCIDNDWVQLQVRMFRVATKNRFIMPEIWLFYVDRELEKQPVLGGTMVDIRNISTSKYSDLDVRSRILIFHLIVEMQFDRPETLRLDRVEETEARQWRVENIGIDSSGVKYWCFDGIFS
jgi:hypothetical protein